MIQKTREITRFLYNHPFVRYVFVGGSTFAIDFSLLFILHEFANLSLPWATSIAYWIAIAYNFILNRSWTFSATEKENLRRHLVSYLLLLGLNYIFTVLFVSIVGRHIYFGLAKALAVIIQVVWTYPAYKHIIFIKTQEKIKQPHTSN